MIRGIYIDMPSPYYLTFQAEQLRKDLKGRRIMDIGWLFCSPDYILKQKGFCRMRIDDLEVLISFSRF